MLRAFWIAVALVAMVAPAVAADHAGQVTVGGLPVPGATVTAVRDGAEIITTSDEAGVFRLTGLAEGEWTVRVEMPGFAPLVQSIVVGADTSPSSWAMTIVPIDARAATPAVQRFDRPSAVPAQPPPSLAVDEAAGRIGAEDGLLINGSVNNGAASPFAQARAFGNNRPGQRSLYNGGLGLLMGHSAWDARPFSFAGARTPKPDYRDVHVLATFGGPFRIPGLFRNGGNAFFGYQRTADHDATTQSARMPTEREREGLFDTSIVDPLTGAPFAGNRIPRERISPQAAALLALYPIPNVDGDPRYNFQTPVVANQRQDNVETRLTRGLSSRDSVSAFLTYRRTRTESTSIFTFTSEESSSVLDAQGSWAHRFSPFLTMRFRYTLGRTTADSSPYFAHRANVSGDARILGTDQSPGNWGPPTLSFSSGLAGLTDVLPAATDTMANGAAVEALSGRGRHYLTVGAGVRRHHLDINAQQDPRGTLTFTGWATGSDVADFLLGLPRTTSIATGNADKAFRALSFDAFITDDWRISPSLSVNLGVRWEYEQPFVERDGRVVNLDLAPDFSAASPVVGAELRPDRGGVQPRLGVAWRPVAGSSLVVRAGYGIYRNTSVYPSIVTLLAQQPPLSRTYSLENGAPLAFTLADAFLVPGASGRNTFAVDPAFRIGFAQNWQTSVQRDLPGSLTVIATYLGTHGSRLMQAVLPNTDPVGAPQSCPTCPSGFIYLTSNGESSRHAAQLQLRRRLRNGLTASVQYTLARAMDDAASFAGASLAGAAIAQDWRNVAAEYAPSNFDQRHLITAESQYTLKGWTFTARANVGSGLPLTPVYLTSVAGTGVTGTIRPDRVNSPRPPEGYYADPSAFARPEPGRWGTAGRNSVTGPTQFGLNAGVGRTFPWGERLNLDWRLDATNVLNRVTYTAVNMLVGSPQFGLPTRANAMRKLQTSLRLRF